MNLLELVTANGGKASMDALAGRLNLDRAQTGALLDAVSPALLRGIQKSTTTTSGVVSFSQALQRGSHQQYIDEPATMGSIDSVIDGNKILGHLFGSKDTSRKVAAQSAEETGIDMSTIKKALPLLAGLAMGAISKKSNAGRSIETASGGLLEGLLGKGSALADAVGLAKKLF